MKTAVPALPRRIAVTLALPAALIATWWFTSAHSQNFYFPPLRTIVETFGKLWFSSQSMQNVVPSLVRLFGRLPRRRAVGHRDRHSGRRLAQSAQRA